MTLLATLPLDLQQGKAQQQHRLDGKDIECGRRGDRAHPILRCGHRLRHRLMTRERLVVGPFLVEKIELKAEEENDESASHCPEHHLEKKQTNHTDFARAYRTVVKRLS